MNILIWLAVGAAVGWFGSILVRTDSQEGLIRNIAIGIAGAVGGHWVLGLASDPGSGGVSIGGILASILGAIVLFAVARRLSRT